jgi:hypothetical protein
VVAPVEAPDFDVKIVGRIADLKTSYLMPFEGIEP